MKRASYFKNLVLNFDLLTIKTDKNRPARELKVSQFQKWADRKLCSFQTQKDANDTSLQTTWTRQRVCQNPSKGNKQWPCDHPEVMDVDVNESLTGTLSGSCLVIIHSPSGEKKSTLWLDPAAKGRGALRRTSSSVHRKLLHLRRYLGQPERKSDESQSEPLCANKGCD